MGRYRRQGCRLSYLPQTRKLLAFPRLPVRQDQPDMFRADHIDGCPLPTHQLRNGRLNQMAYSLFLFIRDITDGDLVGWIDRQFQAADDSASLSRLAQLREAVIGPLREVYGVSDKVLNPGIVGLGCQR